MELTAQVNQVKTRASSENSWVGDGTEQISLNVGEKKVTFKVTEADGALEPINEENPIILACAFETTDCNGVVSCNGRE